MHGPHTTGGEDWHEVYEGGSAEAERALFDAYARQLMRVQARTARRERTAPARTFHAKAALGVENARLRVREDLPPALRAGFAQPGAEYPVTVRLSNAAGRRRPDTEPDLRGAALRVHATDCVHDLLMTSFPVSHARDAREFVAFAAATAAARTRPRQAFALYVRLPLAVGRPAAARMRRTLYAATRRTVRSLALETYFSRGAILWDGAGPVRYLLRPAPDTPREPAAGPGRPGPDHLRREVHQRLKRADIVFELCVQRYVSARLTPIEDGSADWPEQVAPAVPVATLVIPRQDTETPAALAAAARVEALAFNPWHTTEEFRPLGNLNRARKAAYEASSAHRRGERFLTDAPGRTAVAGAAGEAVYRTVNRVVPWHRLPRPLQMPNLFFLRRTLRRANLIDTDLHQAPPRPVPVPPPADETLRLCRSPDGTYNDLSAPGMGAVGAAFGRNLPPVLRADLFDEPNAYTVSRRLLDREEFLPASSLSLLAAAWIQFQVHDWTHHKRYPPGVRSVEVPLPPGVDWRNSPGGPVEHVMRVAADMSERPDGQGAPVTFGDVASHWWDGSELYGGDPRAADRLRGPGGDLRLEDGLLPAGPDGIPVTGFHDNWWLGLSALHTLFAREHNAVCAALRREYPAMDDTSVYHTARLVVSALIAKIHTLEWTPAILATQTIRHGGQTTWQGLPHTWLGRLWTWLFEESGRTGIPRTLPEHGVAPYALTEDFVTVYRMHPLIPDDVELYDHRSGRRLAACGFPEVSGAAAEQVLRETGLANCLYSFGIAHPGAITLRNYPRALQYLRRDGEIIDLSVVDLVRTRRRGVPRYNDFRAGLHKGRIRRFEDLTGDPEALARLKEVYRSVDEIDTMVGLFAENPPEGFGFSDTAFRVFLLMAARRLQSDRFLTVDFRPEIYTPLGMDWIQRGGMTAVVLRHCPRLARFMTKDANVFTPWPPALPAPGPGRH
ncbi:peroxidase family protein [Streptomyces sp. B1866]|uniref:peroxidase family protein n=1 Tax=Streptomyces sp. B1866 TaxID=3075431 RepID=UPI00288DB870|nr:peroxidase family protein [Streptomyces sp. B1866]MDT3397942.1 peroxidase family protein [Streptomyces sp. B1866]